MMRRVLAGGVAVLAITAGIAALTPAPAFAVSYWRTTASGAGRALAQSIPGPAAPVAVVNGPQVTVTWSATTMSGGSPVPGYVVRRYNQSNVSQTVNANCSGTVTTTSCVEMLVPPGQWRYSVHGVVGTFWVGPESAQGAAVTVGTASFLVTSSMPITTLPATVTGTISGFGPSEALTYRLDGATGPTLSGSPAAASAVGGGTISVTIPASASDAPHSIFVVGGLGSTAAAAINIVIPPKLVSLQMRDSDKNGKVDQVLATFDDNLGSYAAGVAPWTLSNVPSGGTLQLVSVSGMVATLTLSEGAAAASTAAGSFQIAMAANSAGVRDINDHPSSFAATAVVDAAAPAATSLLMQDINANGKVDRVVATFSETLAAYSAGTTPWALANTPSGGTLSGVTVSGTTATLAISEGAGAPDTAVGSFTMALAATATTGIRDSLGNLSSFAAQAPADGVVPVRTALEFFDTNKNGKVDRVVATYSETLATTTATAPWTLTNVPSAGTLSSVSASGTAVTLTLAEGAGAAATAPGTFSVALAANAAGVRDVAGNQASFAAVAPVDKAAPALISLQLLDNNSNGKVDRLTATFSETLVATTATGPWTLAGVPSAGSLASLSSSTATVTVTLTEGSGAVDTGVGSMTVSLAANSSGVKDSAGNLTSFTGVAPADGAKPLPVTIADTNGANDGKIETGDTLSITFSEPMNPASAPTSTTVTLTDPSTTGFDTLTITGITSGARSTGSNSYVGTNNTSAAFANSAVTWSNGNRTVTITVGSACAGTGCASLGQATTAAVFSYAAATTLTDVAANVPLTTAVAPSMRLF
jgi:hypothetical protein